MYTLYTLVLTTAKARMFSDQVVNTWSFVFFHDKHPTFVEIFNKK